MGLFSNNKKLCPICGSPTPRLLPTKVEDMPLCKECAGKVDLPDGVYRNRLGGEVTVRNGRLPLGEYPVGI